MAISWQATLALFACISQGLWLHSSAQGSLGCLPTHTCLVVRECHERLRDHADLRRSLVVFSCSIPGSAATRVCCPPVPAEPPAVDVASKMRLLPSTCGQATTDKIIGGTNALQGEFPWLVLLGYKFNTSEELQYLCGGSLITNRYVLTAAHCLYPEGGTLVSIRLGEHNLNTTQDCEKRCLDPDNCDDVCTDPVLEIPVEKAIPHEQYNTPQQLKNDIALVRLAQPVMQFTDYIIPICLPFGVNMTGEEQTEYDIAGWGVTQNYDTDLSPVLQKARVMSVSLSACNRRQAEEVRPLGDGQMCAGQRGVDACKGDSGGPLMQFLPQPDKPTAMFVLGVVSFGTKPCGAQFAPSVYSRVTTYLDWIMQNIDE